MTKFIFVTGGVVSSLGKGITTAAMAVLLEKRGLKVSIQKLDPYINVDPGTMSPFEHGEVYVTEDGAETDLDLGHYERFSHAAINRYSNATTGSIYSEVIRRERKGDYLGKTVQVIPHITDQIQMAIRQGAQRGIDIAIVEVGGTAGDIESLPFLEAIRQFGLKLGKGNVCYVHLTLLPYLSASGEMKTKPTQETVRKMREIGIQPDILVCRCERPMTAEMGQKIAMFCNVVIEDVIQEMDVPHTIYEVPLDLVEQGMDDSLVRCLGLQDTTPGDMSDWVELQRRFAHPKGEIEIAVVGKYIELHDAYKSIYEALSHGGIHHEFKVRFRKIAAEEILDQGAEQLLNGVSGVLIPGGFGERGMEGKIRAIQWARENEVPTFGICFGMQAMAIEYARNVAGIEGANTTEIDKNCHAPVIDLMREQEDLHNKGGTMRLGAYPCRVIDGTRAAEIYGRDMVLERHRHRWEFNNDYKKPLENAGLTCSGIWEAGGLVETIELSDRPFYIGVQYHPEYKSKPLAAHPLFHEFIGAALAAQNEADESNSSTHNNPKPATAPTSGS
jgi:CTP synthase